MPKPYALGLYNSVLGNNAFVRSITSEAKGWKRSIRNMGGPWQGSFTMEGTPAELSDWFWTWLGYDLKERAAGLLSWRGMVYEMDLTLNGITRRRSLDMMANRLKTTYLTLAYTGNNFVHNEGFEDYNVGVPDDFYGWLENVGGGAIQASAVAPHGGVVSIAMTGDGTAENVWVRQGLNVTPGAKYRLIVWNKGDGAGGGPGNSGKIGIRQPNAPTFWIWGPAETLQTSATWDYRKIEFIGPSDGEIIVFLYAPDNAGRTTYFDDIELLEEGQAVFETNWATLDATGAVVETDPATSPPIQRYGLKEEVIHLDNYPEETSIAYRDTWLKEHAYPWARPVAANRNITDRLEVFVAGYVMTANWLYVQEGDGAEDDVDAWMTLILGTTAGRSTLHGGTSATAGDCQFLYARQIMPNDYLTAPAGPLQVPQTTGVEERPWDVLQELVSLGDMDGNPWRMWVLGDGGVVYRPLDINPRYYIRRDGIFDTMSGVVPSNPWTMVPAVFRDMTYRPPQNEPGSFLDNVQDMLVQEVEMADGWDQPSLKTELYNEADLLLHEADRGEEQGIQGVPYTSIP